MAPTDRLLPLAAAALFSLTAHAASAGAANAADATVFARYAGTWKMELHRVQTPYSKPSNESMTVKNDCWHSEVFYVCDQIIDDVPKALIVFFYNAEDKIYGSFPITAGSESVRRAEVLVAANTITFPWQINDNGKTVSMRIVNKFTNPDTMEFRQEYSEDGNTWLPIATGIERKFATKGK